LPDWRSKLRQYEEKKRRESLQTKPTSSLFLTAYTKTAQGMTSFKVSANYSVGYPL
jgi:hypothetical protein